MGTDDLIARRSAPADPPEVPQDAGYPQVVESAGNRRQLADGDAASARQPGTDGYGRVVMFALALLPTLFLVGFWASVDRIERMYMLEDDAFYYLGVARSIVEGDGSTFSGLVETNGYHPLWLLVLIPVTAVVQDPEWLVLGVLLVHGALWAASINEIFRIARTIGGWWLAAGASFFYAVTALLTGHLAFGGMESALALFLFLVLVRLVVELDSDRMRLGDTADLRVGLVLALICLARLDAVFGAMAVALWVLLTGRPTRRTLLGRGFALASPAALALTVYLLVNWALFESPLPVSGRAKSLGASGHNFHQLWNFLKVGKFAGMPLWYGAIGLGLVGLALLSKEWRTRAVLRRLMAVTVALVVGQAVLLAYLVASTSFTAFFPWYHYQLPIFVLGAVLLIGVSAARRFGDRAVMTSFLLLAGGVLVAHAAEIVVKAREENRVGVFAAADFVRRELPEDSILAMGDRAGYFGYMADRPLLQLEGLMADADYLRQIEEGRALERMGTEGVEYYVQNADRSGEVVEVEGRRCHRFVEPPFTEGPTFVVTVCDDDLVFRTPDSTTTPDLTIWRYRPELNGA